MGGKVVNFRQAVARCAVEALSPLQRTTVLQRTTEYRP